MFARGFAVMIDVMNSAGFELPKLRSARAAALVLLLASGASLACVPPSSTQRRAGSTPTSSTLAAPASVSPPVSAVVPVLAPPSEPMLPLADENVAGPPDAVPDCQERLRALGVEFQAAQLPLTQAMKGVFTCGSNDAVVYRRGPTGLRISPPAVMSCRLAIAFVGLERLMQELASARLGSAVARVQHVGTYNCRKMVRFALVSEHSYGNAIDLVSFTLKDGRSISVLAHFGKLEAPPADDKARFLRELGEQAFDRGLIAVSLGPYWDALHRGHFHFDMARYRVDGSRPGTL